MTAGVPLPDAPPASVAQRRAFSVNGITFTVADLARRASVGGREALLVASTPAQAEEAFRRSRGLLRADQLEQWLSDWQIAADDFRNWTADAATGSSTASHWCTVLCSGAFETVAAATASAAAAACELGHAPQDPARFDPADWVDRLVAQHATVDTVSAAVAAHRLEWTWLQIVSVHTQDRGVAEELRHQVVTDGQDLRSAAVRAGCPVNEESSVLDDITPPAVRAALGGALAGEVIGPVAVEEGWALVAVLARTEATLANPATRARAEAQVRRDVIGRAVARHVVA